MENVAQGVWLSAVRDERSKKAGRIQEVSANAISHVQRQLCDRQTAGAFSWLCTSGLGFIMKPRDASRSTGQIAAFVAASLVKSSVTI